ncbi:lipase 3-like [Diabrotica virgifera virgifera]|uniref:Partial AB-hydrolase lipase domain-containing protein n=2 Tax=Diabrotica virgifera virgifera TaxID=50390 RepID=A0ABM5KUI3_DIAVI|nr:lipase 3-like [Diabrotica virgifera virgifera]
MFLTKQLFLIFALLYTAKAGIALDEVATNLVDGLKTDASAIQILLNSAVALGIETRGDIFKTLLDLKLENFGTQKRVSATELIQNEGYPVESYYLTTSDGYILNIFRIPYGKSGKKLNKVVYIQHGFLASSDDWVLMGSKRGLAYILADEGYDVWLGNCRGNFYSRNHTQWNPDKDPQFWQFSWHQIGTTDIPAMIDFIIEITGVTKLYHVGHSQGTTSFYVMASMRPEYNAKIAHHISLAPIAYMNHLFSPLVRALALNYLLGSFTLESLSKNEFLPSSGFLNMLTDSVCSEGVGQVLCKNALFALTGFSPNQMNVSDIPLIMANYPAGAATKQLAHYLQLTNSGRFCQYDFAILKNKEHYGQIIPPDYDLSKIAAPLTLIYSSNDWLAAVVDVERLAKQLPNLKESYRVPLVTWNHIDFLFGKDAPTLVYDKVVSILTQN